LYECCNADLFFRIVRCERREHADPPHPIRLPRAHREWPRGRSAAEQR
jgi:hypothetical protein